ncbi:ATPase family associated domain-containing protein 6 [Phytophthora infestans]|uniref:ATPase family associated domain-containing protein 6 n=1 Tax=Phytophthora infestans TaxID=4787 RepID=A0A833VY50_PHYIN|nr:ATPase family associated domain-containing protein 6 [Phytophthora infestans]
MFVVFPSSVRMRDAEEIRVWTESLSHFAIVQWDQSCIVEALLMSRGFTDPRHLAKQLLILREHARSTLDVSIRSLSVYESLFSFSALKAVINDAASQLALRNIDHKRLIGEAVLRYFSVRVGETQLKDLEAIVKSIFASDNETGLQARISIRPDLQESIRVAARALHFIPRQAMIDSVSSLATALTSSVSTVLVGPSGVGKTTSYQVLAKAFELSPAFE